MDPDDTCNDLFSLRRIGGTHINFRCVSPRCKHSRSMKITDAIVKFGASETLVSLARRARCDNCQRRGVHVDVTFGFDERHNREPGWSPGLSALIKISDRATPAPVPPPLRAERPNLTVIDASGEHPPKKR